MLDETRYDQLIDGEFVPATNGGRIETLNPATEERLAEIPAGTAEDIDRAVAAAGAALDG